MTTELSVTADRHGDWRVVTVEGEVDLSNAAGLGEAISQAMATGGSGVVLDLAGVGFMDSTGLRELLHALERAREQSLELVIACALDSPVRRLLGLTNLDAEFRLVEDVHDAAPTGG